MLNVQHSDSLDILFSKAQERFPPQDLEVGQRDTLIHESIARLQEKGKLDLSDLDVAVEAVVKKAKKLEIKRSEDEIDEDAAEEIDAKNLPKAWKRHTIVLGFGAAAVYFSTVPSQSLTSILFTLGFLKLSKSYMIGFSRIRRYGAVAGAVGTAIALKSIWDKIDLTPLAAGLGIDALTFTAKAYMKGKLKKDEGPEETNPALRCIQNGTNRACNLLGSCVDGIASRISRCCGYCFRKLCCK